MSLTPAENQIWSIGTLLMDVRAHVYAPVVVGRAALEACGRAAHLAEPGLGARRRVARGMTERLHSLTSSLRVKALESVQSRLQERRSIILEEAARQGFRKLPRRGRPPELEEERPGNEAVVRRLFGDSTLGATLYAAWSAVSHSTLYGLTSSMTPTGDETAAGMTGSAVGIGSDQAEAICHAVLLGYVSALRRQEEVLGWRSESCKKSIANAVHLIQSRDAGAGR